ncbi:MAG: DUF5028 domain-containing protein [Ruminococcus sp.]|nr:DUF5028 domain-containing protein [Ruminococcus sp.]
MLYKVFNRKRKIFAFWCMALSLMLLIVWFIRIISVNTNAFHQTTEIYNTDEMVNLDGNFFFDSNEDTKGYFIKVNKAILKDYKKYLNSYGEKVEEDPEFPTPKYVCLINVTIKNENNSNGYLNTLGFSLFDRALQIPIDYEVWNLIDESIDGNTSLKLRKNSEVTLDLPFVAQSLDEDLNSKELNDRLENNTFQFFICDFPIRKLINVKFTK